MLEWFSRTTSISGVQISNYWMLVLAAVVVIWIVYRFIAVDVNGIANDPPGVFGCQEGDNAADVVGLRNALERLHPKDDLASGIRLGEVRHIRLDDAGCDSIDADTAHAQAA
jgi:hypothetical protein